jgi:hypothetical protein
MGRDDMSDNDDDDGNVSSSSASVTSSQLSDKNRERRRHSRTKTSSKHKKKRSSSRRDRDRLRRSRDSDTSSNCDDSRRKKKKRRKREETTRGGGEKKRDRSRSRSKREHRDRDRAETSGTGSSRRNSNSNSRSTGLERNYALADALCGLFQQHPALSADVPAMLLRLAGGTAFDLRHMPDASAAEGLAAVLACLGPFGVTRDDHRAGGAWVWQNPAGSSSISSSNTGSASANNHRQLVLVRLVRAMLDQIGITVEAIDSYENPPQKNQVDSDETSKMDTSKQRQSSARKRNEEIERQTLDILRRFRDGELSKELGSLCQMILDGEMIALEGLPNQDLLKGLESLFTACGLEKSEMEQDGDNDDDHDDDDEEGGRSSLGYGLPDIDDNVVKDKLLSVLKVCRETVTASRAIKGPMMDPRAYEGQLYPDVEANNDSNESSDEDSGPLRMGEDRRGPKLTTDEIKARAIHRATELECIKRGVAMPASDGTAREEWMLVPGKFDFLSAVRAGQPVRSRQFEGKKRARSGREDQHVPIDPAVQLEILAIRQAHDDARGPSLLGQHRERKQQAAAAAKSAQSSSGQQGSWKWDRDRDLDDGRRVDKDALNMILGGAGGDLKTKFHTSM